MRLISMALVAVLLAACTPEVKAAGNGGDGTKVVVELTDIKFTPATIQIEAGKQVTLEVRNRGSLDHDLVIDAIKVQSRVLKPGQSQSITVGPFPSGTSHDFYCSVTGHRSAGMVGRLVVK